MSFRHDPRDAAGNISRQEFINKLAESIINLLKPIILVELNSMTRTCMNCDHWVNNVPGCSKFKALPPPHIIASGCNDHVDITIPF